MAQPVVPSLLLGPNATDADWAAFGRRVDRFLCTAEEVLFSTDLEAMLTDNINRPSKKSTTGNDVYKTDPIIFNHLFTNNAPITAQLTAFRAEIQAMDQAQGKRYRRDRHVQLFATVEGDTACVFLDRIPTWILFIRLFQELLCYRCHSTCDGSDG